MYSGGGGSASQLHLLELDGARAAPALGGEVLVVPWEASLMIRACFSEEDMKDRLEACHDEYDFGATLAVASMGGGAFPTLSYRVVATAFPRTSRRSTDNSEKPLTRADPVRAQHPVCTYARVLRYAPPPTRHKIQRPPPACSSHTSPYTPTPPAFSPPRTHPPSADLAPLDRQSRKAADARRPRPCAGSGLHL